VAIDSFEDLEVWKSARLLVKSIYSATRADSFAKDFGLRDQVRRAAVSIASNIAEGFERHGNVEFVRFLYIAKGSAGEVRAQLYLALDLGYIEKAEFTKIHETVASVSRQLSGFIQYLQKCEATGTSRLRTSAGSPKNL
jgi:four helix bundle protein